ncbi:hypothetical protein ABT294_11275 [Nonomuraea sp. NPDC000554]
MLLVPVLLVPGVAGSGVEGVPVLSGGLLWLFFLVVEALLSLCGFRLL